MMDTTTIPPRVTVRKEGHRYHDTAGVPKEVRVVSDEGGGWQTFVTLEMPSGAREEFMLADTDAG